MQDTYVVSTVDKSIAASGQVATTIVVLNNQTNTFGPSTLTVVIRSDFPVKPGDTHTLSLT